MAAAGADSGVVRAGVAPNGSATTTTSSTARRGGWRPTEVVSVEWPEAKARRPAATRQTPPRPPPSRRAAQRRAGAAAGGMRAALFAANRGHTVGGHGPTTLIRPVGPAIILGNRPPDAALPTRKEAAPSRSDGSFAGRRLICARARGRPTSL
uniref:Uncharacterized protein n=1 Tax=Plectus sambesii TaxID=2011161 RepID=A0A914WMM0_9BILA